MQLPDTRYAITRDGVHIAYQTVGEGTPDIAYVGGYATHVEVELELSWAARYNRNLASIGRLIRFDKRGSGLSERASPLSDLETRTDDLRAVLDAVGSERVVLIGEGEGGALASFFAATYPDRTMGLVWIGPYARTAWAPDYPWGWPSEEEARAVELIRTTWGTHAYAKELLRGDISSVADDEEWVAWAAKYFRYSMSPGEAVRFEQMWYETDARAILPAVSVPTLLICPVLSHDPGEDSHVVLQARDVAERMVGSSRLVILPPGDWAPVSPGRQDQVVEEIRAFVDELTTEQLALDRVLATVLFTDIVDSTARASELGDRGWGDVVERHHAIVRSFLSRYRGIEVDTAGDGFFATFDGPARAVRCAQSVADAVRSLGVQVRAGVHTGEVETIAGKAGGVAVVIGSRIGGLARPSEVLVSSTVKDLTVGSGLAFEDAGEHELKGVPDRWRLYRVVA